MGMSTTIRCATLTPPVTAWSAATRCQTIRRRVRRRAATGHLPILLSQQRVTRLSLKAIQPQWFTVVEDVLKVYLAYRNTCGWWNKDCTIHFGLAEFLGMWILMESNATLDLAEILTTVVAQNLFVGGWRPAVCETQCYTNAVFNFMAAYSQGTGGLFQGPGNLSVRMYARNNPGLEDLPGLLSSLGAKALDPASVVLWDRWNGPSNWGNIKGAEAIAKGIKDNHREFGTAYDTVYFMRQSAVYLSVNQYRYWQSLGVDMSFDVPGQ